MRYDAHTVAVVMATGAIAVTAAVVTGGLIGAAMWAALTLENRARVKAANTTRGMR